MTDLINLEIASVNFTIHCDSNINITQNDPSYEAFLQKAPDGSETINIKVNISAKEMPDTRSFTKVFDSGQAWSLLQHKSYHYVVQNTLSSKSPILLTRVNKDFTEADIYCGNMFKKVIEKGGAIANPLEYPLDQILLMHILTQKEGVIIHSTGIVVDGCCLIFPGRSGAGKSTISKCFLGLDDAEVLSDDRIVVRKLGDTFRGYGTPWPGEAEIAVNENFPISAFLFLHHSAENSIVPISPEKAFERLLPVSSIPWYDKNMISKSFDFCSDLTAEVPAYDLHFRPGVEITEIIRHFRRTE